MVHLDRLQGRQTRVAGAELGEPGVLGRQKVVRFGDTLAVVDDYVAQRSDAGTTALWGKSPRIARVREAMLQAAPEPVPVLIQGETGRVRSFWPPRFIV